MSGGDLRVFVVDLLSISPFYDRYLVEALQSEMGDVRLYAATFPYEPDYWESVNVVRAPGLLDRVGKLGVANKRVRRGLQLLEYLANWAKLVQDVRRERPEVVHIQWLPLLERTGVELRGVRLLQRLGAAVVYTAHNALPHDGPPALLPRYRAIYQQMDQVVVHTRTERDRLVEGMSLSPGRISIAPHGPMFHDLPPASPAEARERLGLADGDEVVLFLGLLRPYKGLEDLLEAMTRVVRERPRSLLLLAGQGEPAYERSLAALVERLGLSPRVRLLSRYVPVAEIPLLHAAATVTVLPYREASQSGALFTAASFDVPLVATSVGGMGEVLDSRRCAVLVPPSDPSALAAALLEVLSHPPGARLEMASKLRQWVQDECGWDAIAARTGAAYRSAIAHRSAMR